MFLATFIVMEVVVFGSVDREQEWMSDSPTYIALLCPPQGWSLIIIRSLLNCSKNSPNLRENLAEIPTLHICMFWSYPLCIISPMFSSCLPKTYQAGVLATQSWPIQVRERHILDHNVNLHVSVLFETYDSVIVFLTLNAKTI